MKLKILLSLVIFFSALTNLPAKNINIEQARKVAINFLRQASLLYSTGNHVDKIRLEDPYSYIQGGIPVFYAFNTNPGFIIISGEDAFTPVIGYSFENKFQLEGAPSNYRGFIQNYIDQIQYIRDNNLEADQEISEAWEGLTVDKVTDLTEGRNGREVAPLLLSLWDQGSPYNLLCPADPAGPGGHVWAGCVATAMAQVMYYWRYPETGTGSHCYYASGYGQQCADFGETHYNWEGMRNGMDIENPYPIAELQYHCGVSVDMMYSPNGSGAYSYMVPERLAQYLGYDNAEYLEKDSYSLTDWMNILKGELDNGHPMYYSGFNESWEGHAFVCDGYQGDNFHFNFGWSGSSNGYYSLYSVGGFYLSQAIVKNFVPSDPGYPYPVTGNVVLNQESGSFTDGSGPVDNYINNQNASWLIDASSLGDSITGITLKFYQFDLLAGDSVKVYDGANSDGPVLGSYSGNNIPASITTTGSKMLVSFVTDGSGTSAGWYAEYKVNTAVFCSGIAELTEPYGTIEDGSGSYNYHNNAYCRWLIKPPYANKITLSFNQFNTEDQFDFLAVFDGSTEIGQYSGNIIPGPVVATSGSVFIVWHTNSTTNLQGWSLSYEVDNTGIPDNSPVHSLDIYPNPATDKLNVVFNSESDGTMEISLINLTGQVVLNDLSENSAGNYHSVLDVKTLPAGIYFLELKSSSTKIVRKVVVEKN
jgi:hypothetical protein